MKLEQLVSDSYLLHLLPLHQLLVRESPSVFLENATVRGGAWYKTLDAPVLTLDVTVLGDLLCHTADYKGVLREP